MNNLQLWNKKRFSFFVCVWATPSSIQDLLLIVFRDHFWLELDYLGKHGYTVSMCKSSTLPVLLSFLTLNGPYEQERREGGKKILPPTLLSWFYFPWMRDLSSGSKVMKPPASKTLLFAIYERVLTGCHLRTGIGKEENILAHTLGLPNSFLVYNGLPFHFLNQKPWLLLGSVSLPWSVYYFRIHFTIGPRVKELGAKTPEK